MKYLEELFSKLYPRLEKAGFTSHVYWLYDFHVREYDLQGVKGYGLVFIMDEIIEKLMQLIKKCEIAQQNLRDSEYYAQDPTYNSIYTNLFEELIADYEVTRQIKFTAYKQVPQELRSHYVIEAMLLKEKLKNAQVNKKYINDLINKREERAMNAINWDLIQ